VSSGVRSTSTLSDMGSALKSAFSCRVVSEIYLSDGRVVVCVDEDDREYFLFSFLEEGDEEEAAVVGGEDEGWVLLRGKDCVVGYFFIGEEELELVLVVVVPQDYWVEVYQAVWHTLRVKCHSTHYHWHIPLFIALPTVYVLYQCC